MLLQNMVHCKVGDENNIVSLGVVADRIRVKMEIVGIVFRFRFNILVGFVPNRLWAGII